MYFFEGKIKRIISFILAFAMMLPNFAYAAEKQEVSLDLEGLQVSKEYVEKHPNGVFEVASPLICTTEGEEFDFIVIRRGGTEGKVSVNLKAIETISKYGEDFVMLAQNKLGFYTEVKKDGDSLSILENYIEEQKNANVTTDNIIKSDSSDTVSPITTDNVIQGNDSIITDNVTDNIVDVPTTDKIVNAGLGNYTSALHKLRDEATGVKTMANAEQIGQKDFFEVNDPENVQLSNEVNALMPGASYTVDFDDGEAYKIIKIKIKDDKIYESQETFSLVLYDPTNGAELGDSLSSTCTVNDNDKIESSVISFESKTKTVLSSDSDVTVKISRTGNINDFVNLKISTLADSAKADKHYEPIIGETMFLPGESEKTVVIPLFTDTMQLKEPIYFEIVAQTEDNASIPLDRMGINIVPAVEEINEPIINFADKNSSIPTTNSLQIETTEDANSDVELFSVGTDDHVVRVISDLNHFCPSSGLRSDYRKWNSNEHWYADLIGIDRITMIWSNPGITQSKYISRQQSSIQFGDLKKTKYGVFGEQYIDISSAEMRDYGLRNDHVWFEFKSMRSHGNPMNYTIKGAYAHYTNFKFNTANPDALTAYTYSDADTVVPGSEVKFIPGNAIASSPYVIRGENFRLNSNLSKDGKKYGANFDSYSIIGNNASRTITNRDMYYDLSLSKELIRDIIYNGNSSANSFTCKPKYSRTERREYLNIGDYDSKMGTLKIGGVAYDNQTIKSSKWKMGDLLKVDVIPNEGYNIQKIKAVSKSLWGETSELYDAGEPIPIDYYKEIVPLFQRDDNKVTLAWEELGTGEKENKETNLKHGMIFHDKNEKMTAAQTDAIKKGVPSLPKQEEYYNLLSAEQKNNVRQIYVKKYADGDENLVSKADVSFEDFCKKEFPDSFKQAIDAPIKAEIDRVQRQNYMNNLNLFSEYSLENMSIGNVVTFYAKPDPGYTCLWEYTDGKKNLAENELLKRVVHVGNSFTFEVEDSGAKINYYFEKINTLDNKIIRGKVIKSNDTLLKQNGLGVDINDRRTYTPVANADVTIGALDADLTKDINGVTYKVSGQTDSEGNFALYAPNGTNGMAYNVVFASGGKVYPKHTVIKQKAPVVYFAVPFMNPNFRITSLDFNMNSYGASRINVLNESRTITAKARPATGYQISKLVLRSYDSKGSLWKVWDMAYAATNVYNSEFNAKEYLKDGGRLTVEAYNIYGVGQGEIETGYSFIEPPAAANMTLPSMDTLGGAELPVVGNTIPGFDLGEYSDITPTYVEPDTADGDYSRSSDVSAFSASDTAKQDVFEIAVLSGTIIKSTIKQSQKDKSEVFKTGTISERVNTLTSAIGARSSTTNATSKEYGKDVKKNSKAGKFSTAGGKANLDVNLDVGFYMSMVKVNNAYQFRQLYGLFGVQVEAKKDFGFFVGPIPIYATIAGRIGIKGLVGIVPAAGYEDKILVGGQSGWFNKTMNTECYTDGVIGIFPWLSIGAGAGVRGVLSLGVSGQMNMAIVYQPWSNGAGTVEFSLNVDIDILIIPITFSVASIKLKMFETKGYVDTGWVDLSDVKGANSRMNGNDTNVLLNEYIDENMSGSINNVSRAKNSNTFEPEVSLRMFNEDEANESVKLLSDVRLNKGTKHPKPQLMSLGGDKQLMLYIGDDANRDDYDCTAAYYTVYDGNSWAEPKLLDDDGTYDSDITVTKIYDDKVMVAWGDSSEKFGNTMPEVKDYLNSSNISYCIFDSNGNKEDNQSITKEDKFSNAMPRVTYDTESKKTLIVYNIVDYNDMKVEFKYDNLEDLNEFFSNAYSAIAFKVLNEDMSFEQYGQNELSYINYENSYGEGVLDNQRFVDVNISNTQEQANVYEISANSYDGKAFICYTIDIDGDDSTNEDKEIYVTVLNYNNNKMIGPVKVTDNEYVDSNPQTVKYNDSVWLYWNHNNTISYVSLSDMIEGFVVEDTSTEKPTYSVIKEYFDNAMVILEENSDAAQTFNISLQPDGNVYLTWNQLEQFDDKSKTAPEDDLYGEEATSQFITKRSLYLRVYDPKYSYEEMKDPEYGDEIIYTGNWGKATRIDEPENGNTYYNEQSLSAKDTSNIFTVFRRYNMIDNGEGGNKEESNSDIVIHQYKLVSTLKINDGDVEINPAHPIPGDTATLLISATNIGVLPSDKVTFVATMTDSNGNVTDLGEIVYDNHMTTEGSLVAKIGFTMPENAESIKFNVQAWENDLKETACTYEYVSKSASEAVVNNLDIGLINNNTANIEAKIISSGNKPIENLKLKVEKCGDVLEDVFKPMVTEFVNIYEKTFEPLNCKEAIAVNEKFAISNDLWGQNKSMKVLVSVLDGERVLYEQYLNIQKINDKDVLIEGILINDLQSTEINMLQFENVYPSMRIYPFEAKNNYTLTYEIADKNIAVVDQSNGRVTGVNPGETKLIIKAIMNEERIFVDEENRMFAADGKPVKFDESGMAINFDAENNNTAAFTKEVKVIVNPLESSSDNEDSDNKKPDKNVIDPNKGNSYFNDIEGNWAELYINELYKKNYIKGKGNKIFAPYDNIKRAEIVSILANISGKDMTETGSDFDDVSKDSWYNSVITWAVKNNIISGVGNKMFAPEKEVTREDMAVIVYRYMLQNGYKAKDGDVVPFTDGNEVSDYAKIAVEQLQKMKIITGYKDGSFKPKNNITRAEAAAMLYKLFIMGGENNEQ